MEGCAPHADIECLCDVKLLPPIALVDPALWIDNPAANLASELVDGKKDIAAWSATYLSLADKLLQVNRFADLNALHKKYHNQRTTGFGINERKNQGTIIRQLLKAGVPLELIPDVLGVGREEIARMYSASMNLSFDELLALQKELRVNPNRHEIAQQFNISQYLVSTMARCMPDVPNQKSKNQRTVSEFRKEQMRKLAACGASQKYIANKYHVDQSYVSRVCAEVAS